MWAYDIENSKSYDFLCKIVIFLNSNFVIFAKAKKLIFGQYINHFS